MDALSGGGLAFVTVVTTLVGVWLHCRLTAQPCPNCGSQWQTELMGEWDGEEDWRCHNCDTAWGHRFAPPYQHSTGHKGAK